MGKARTERLRREVLAQQALTRRRFLVKCGAGASVLTGLGFAGWKALDSLGNVSFAKAYDSPALRERWLQTATETRPYVTKHIATPAHLADLKARYNFTPEKGMFASTVMRDQSMVTRGAFSDVFLYDEVFNSDFKPIVKSLGRVIANVVTHHELVHADHWYAGIPGYPREWFFDGKGMIDDNRKRELLLLVSEVVAHRKEYDGLVAMKHKDSFIIAYHASLAEIARPLFVRAYALAQGNTELQAKIQREAWF